MCALTVVAIGPESRYGRFGGQEEDGRAGARARGAGGADGRAAHPEVSPQLVNRYLAVIVLGDRLEYFVTLLYGPLPAVDVRKADGRRPRRQIARPSWSGP